MRIAIVGATGNVGTSLVEALSADPAVEEIVGIARRVPEWSPPKTRWLTADITADPLTDYLRGQDAVVHLAWQFHPMRKPVVTWRANVRGSARVFDAAAAAGVGTLVYASSVGAYSPGPKDHPVAESWPTEGWPTAAYAREKAYVERLLDGFEAQNPDMRVVRLRPGFIFKRESGTQQRRLFAGPLVPRRLLRPERIPVVPDFPGLVFQGLHTRDAAQAYHQALQRPVRGAFNVAADPVMNGRALARLLGARRVPVPGAAARAGLSLAHWLHAVPVAPPLLDVLTRIPVMATDRARAELGWQPTVSAEDALLEGIAGMREAAGWSTPPLDPATSGPLRAREFATGIGSELPGQRGE